MTEWAMDQNERRYNEEQASMLKYDTLPALQGEFDRFEEQARTRMQSDEVGPERIARVVSRWTGVPVERLTEGEKDKL